MTNELPKHEKTLSRFAILATVILFILGGIMVARAADTKEEAQREDRYWEFVRVFSELEYVIRNNYVEEKDPTELYRAAIDGMMASLDQHSQYMPADSFAQLEKDTGAEFSGIGIHLTRRDGLLTVIAPIPGGPSARLGLQPWDRITAIEGESTARTTMTEAVRKLTGPVGTEVMIKYWRPGFSEPRDLVIRREKIRIRNVYSKVMEDGIGLIRIAKFSDRASADIVQILNDFREQGVRGIILDLRFDSGGLLDEAISISDLFLERDAMIVSTRGRDGVVQQEFRAKTRAVVDWPIMVLVNAGSASASEILAAALRDHHKAVIVGPQGERTFGKGSVQTVIPQQHSFEHDELGNHRYGGYRLTTAKYYTPSGETIDGKGIKPDVEVELPEGQIRDLLVFGLIGEPDLRGPNADDPEFAEKDEEEAAAEEGDGPKMELPLGPIVPSEDDLEDDAVLDPDAPIETQTERPEDFDFTIAVKPIPNVSSPKTFVDVQLQEAVRLLRDYLTLEQAA